LCALAYHRPDANEGARGDSLAGKERMEETRRNFQNALAAHFEAMREVGEPIPEPHTSVIYVEVAA